MSLVKPNSETRLNLTNPDNPDRSQPASGPRNGLGDVRVPWDMSALQGMVQRDKDYVKLFSKSNDMAASTLETLLDRNSSFINIVLKPMDLRIQAHFQAYHSPSALHSELFHAVSSYRRLLFGPGDFGDALAQLKDAARALGRELTDSEAAPCAKANKSMADVKTEWSKRSLKQACPIPTWGSHIYCMMVAILSKRLEVIAEWLDCTAPPEATSLATTGTTTLPKACAAIHNVPFGIQFARNTSLLT